MSHDPMTSTTAPAQQPYAADGTTISAAALVARIAALEAQVLAAQKANTNLIKRIVELEHQLETASGLIIRYARLVDGALLSAPSMQLESVSSFPSPRAVDPARLCDHCGLPLVSSHIADEVRLELAGRRISAHRRCADYLRDREGWTPVATARGGV